MDDITADQIEDLSLILKRFEALPQKRLSKSVFSIAGYSHYENMCSNVLSFYLNPANEHGLGTLMLESLLNCIDHKLEKYPCEVHVAREFQTLKGGRLDIFVKTDHQVIGIENKIKHWLANDLEDYSDTIDQHATKDSSPSPHGRKTSKIVLSIKKEPVRAGFKAVTYADYWDNVKKLLGCSVTTASQKWILYLIDFMDSIEELFGGYMKFTDRERFIIEERSQIEALIREKNGVIDKLNSQVSVLKDMVDVPSAKPPISKVGQWIYQKSCLVHDFTVGDHILTFDLYVSLDGWSLQFVVRDPGSQAYFDKVLELMSPNAQFVTVNSQRIIVDVFDIDKPLDEIREGLLKWFDLFADAVSTI